MAEPITVTITNLNSPIRTVKVSNKVAESAVTSVAGRVGDVVLTKADIAGVQNVNNTSDLNKPVSIATQAAIDGISLTPGPSGEAGPIGPSGLQGPIGPSGAIGLTGPIGPSGLQGPIGPSGAIGLTGPTGADAVVDNTAYGISWSGDITQAATRDALYQEIEILPRFGDDVSEFNNDAGYLTAGTIDFSLAYTGIAVDYTGLADDYVVDATSADITVTLPTAVGKEGKSYIVKNSSAGVITISPSGAETIDGESSIDTNSKTALTLLSTNSNWIII